MAQDVGSHEPPPDGETSGTSKPVAEMVGDITAEAAALVRKEVELAVSELREEARRAAKAAGMLSAGALSGYLALLFASFALAWFLDRRLPRTLAFLLVSAAHGSAAAALLARAREEAKNVDLVPRQAVASVREDVESVIASSPV